MAGPRIRAPRLPPSNAGVDLTVRLGPCVGVGAQIGWSGAEAAIDLPWNEASQPIILGGIRAGGDLHLRF